MDNSNGILNGILSVVTVIGFLGLLFIFLWSIVWVYHYATRRGKPGLLVVLLVLMFGWPMSLLLWWLFRPADAESA